MSDEKVPFVSRRKSAESGVFWGGDSGWLDANENGRVKETNGKLVPLPATPRGEVHRPTGVVQTRSVNSSESEIICELHGASGRSGRDVGGNLLGGSAGSGAGSTALVADGTVLVEVGGGGGGGRTRRESGDPSYDGGEGGRGGFAEFSLDLTNINELQLYVVEEGDRWGYSTGERGELRADDGTDGGRGGGEYVSQAAGGVGRYRSDSGDGEDGRVYISNQATSIQSTTGGSGGNGKIVLGFE